MSTPIKLQKIKPLYESDTDYNGRIELKHFKQGYYDEDGKRYPIKAVKMLMKDLKRGQVFRPSKPDGTFSTTFSSSVNAPVANRLWARYKTLGKAAGIYVPYDDARGEFRQMSTIKKVSTTVMDRKYKGIHSGKQSAFAFAQVMAYNVFINDWRGE
jgi:hypothetical protein